MEENDALRPDEAIRQTREGVNSQRQKWGTVKDIADFLRDERSKNGFSDRIAQSYINSRRRGI